jgi:hypothetical protein
VRSEGSAWCFAQTRHAFNGLGAGSGRLSFPSVTKQLKQKNCLATIRKASEESNHQQSFSTSIDPASVPASRYTPPSFAARLETNLPPVPPTTMALASRCVRLASRGAWVVRSAALPAKRWNSTAAPTDPKIASIVDQISGLTLLQTAELVSSLKVYPLFRSCWCGQKVDPIPPRVRPA